MRGPKRAWASSVLKRDITARIASTVGAKVGCLTYAHVHGYACIEKIPVNWSRTHGAFRAWILIGLIALLCAGLITHSAAALALAVPVFTFICFLAFVARLRTPDEQVLPIGPARGQIHSRAHLFFPIS
jgi:hypothetical protein